MTGTASELCDYNENEVSDLNSFDLFSVWLFKKINAESISPADSGRVLPILNTSDVLQWPDDTE